MKVTKGHIVFSTGKMISANGGVIGISEPGEDGWQILEGWDGGIDMEELTKGELNEIADYMVNLWERFRNEL